MNTPNTLTPISLNIVVVVFLGPDHTKGSREPMMVDRDDSKTTTYLVILILV